MRLPGALFAATFFLCACGDTQQAATRAAVSNTSSGERARTSASTPSTAKRASFEERHGELGNPDAGTVVLLYYDLAGLSPPIDLWVAEDARVIRAAGIDKAAQRTLVKAELESGLAAVRKIGFLRLSLKANLSKYDPTYEEFTVRALAPSSVVHFDALRHKVSLSFDNARTAQIWRVPAAQAQVVRDQLGYSGAALDVLLKITGVVPGTGGGTIRTAIVDYEMRDARSGAVLARVRLPPE